MKHSIVVFQLWVKEFIGDESGLAVVEYIIGAAGLLVFVVLLFSDFSSALLTKFTNLLNSF